MLALLMAVLLSGVLHQREAYAASTSTSSWITRSSPIDESKVPDQNGVAPSDLNTVETIFGVAITTGDEYLSSTWDCGKNASTRYQKALANYATILISGEDGYVKIYFPGVSSKEKFWTASNFIVATTINGYGSIDNDNKSRCDYVANLMVEQGLISESADESRADFADAIASECGPVWSTDKSMGGAEAASYYNVLLMSFSSKDWESKIVEPYNSNGESTRCSEVDRASKITSLTPAKLKAELVKVCKGNDSALKEIRTFTNLQIAKAYSKVKDGENCKDAISFASKDGTYVTPEDDYTTTCAVDGIGWVLCPVMNFIGKMNDEAFGFLNNFLNVEPELFSDSTSQKAWTTFRDLANVAFVIAFLVIIYSQITGGGVTNYGIKKLLPKLVIAAVLVNVSYIFCQLLVDISNIVGSSIYDLFKSLSVSATGGGTESAWSDAIGAILLGGAAIGLIAVIFFAPTVLLIVGVVVLILIARKALLILLVVISPLAFVAYLLPNTEQWFKKWWKLFWSLLLLYPIVGALFGAGTLAANILMPVAQKEESAMLQIAALAAMALPLLAVPAVLKGALSAAGSLGGRLSALQDRANTRGKRGIKEGRIGEAKGAWDARRQRRKVERRVGNGTIGRINRRIDQSRFGRYIGGDRGAAYATSQFDAAHEEEVKNANTRLQATMSHQEILDAARNGEHNGRQLSEYEREAAIRHTVERGNFNERRDLAQTSGTMTRSQRKSLTGGMRSRGDTDVYGDSALAAIEAGDQHGATGMSVAAATAEVASGTRRKINEGSLSVEAVMKDRRVAAHVARVAPTANAPARADLHAAIIDFATKNPQAWTKLDEETKRHAATI